MPEPVVQTVQAKDIHGNLHDITTDRLRWRPSAYVILKRDDEVLVSPQSGKYDLPGGGVEFGEMPEQAVLREAHEETGLLLARPRLLRVASSYYKMPDRADDFIQTIMLYYTADIIGGELSTDKLDEYERQHVGLAEWMPVDRLDELELTSSIDWRQFVREL